MKKIFPYLVLAGLFVVNTAFGASVFFPYQGGTGTSTVPTAGQILEGRTGGTYGPANFSAGTNITIDTSTPGTIQISASGSGVSTSSPIYSGGLAYFNGSSSITSALPMLYDSTAGRLTLGTSTITALTFTTASGTDLTASGYLQSATLNVSGQSTQGNVSSTNNDISGYLTVGGKLGFGNASGTRLTLPDYLDVGTTTVSGHLSVATTTFSGLFNVGVDSPFFIVYADPAINVFPLYSRIAGPYTLGKGSLTIGTSSANTPDDALFYIATSSPMFFINSQTGKVGIATTTPTNALSVQGSVNVSGSVSSTNVGVTGYGTFPTLNFTTSAGGAITNVSSTRITATTGYDGARADITNVSSTQVNASTLFQGAKISITNASATTITAQNILDNASNRYSTSTAANPTATITSSTQNGTANTFMRSDGAPALGTQYSSSSISFNIYDATTTSPYSYAKWRANAALTLQSVSCDESAAATTTIELFKITAGLATTTNGGTFIPAIQCGIAGSTQNTSGTNSVAYGDFIVANVSSTAGTPTWTTFNVWFSKN